MALQPAGDGSAPRAQPVVGPPLSTRQVAVSIAAIMLFLVLVIILGHWYRGGVTTPPPAHLPVLGIVGQAITIGNTVLGVAFTDTPPHVDHRAAEKGHFYSVGVVIGNRGDKAFQVDRPALALDNGDDGRRYLPITVMWGTPEELQDGKHQTRYSLPPHETIAGLIFFDLPSTVAKPRLLLRDLSDAAADFSGAIDLTHNAREENTEHIREINALLLKACPKMSRILGFSMAESR